MSTIQSFPGFIPADSVPTDTWFAAYVIDELDCPIYVGTFCTEEEAHMDADIALVQRLDRWPRYTVIPVPVPRG